MAGIYGAGLNSTLLVITGITGAVAAALSMAAGSLLSTEAERDLLLAEIKQAKKEFKESPYLAQQSLLEELIESGLEKQTAYNVVKQLSAHEETLFQNFRNTVLGLPGVEDENPYSNAIVMFFAFILGSLFPIVPYLVTTGQTAYIASIIATSLALFVMGITKGYLSKENPIKSGFKFFFIALSAGLISEFVGSWVGVVA